MFLVQAGERMANEVCQNYSQKFGCEGQNDRLCPQAIEHKAFLPGLPAPFRWTCWLTGQPLLPEKNFKARPFSLDRGAIDLDELLLKPRE